MSPKPLVTTTTNMSFGGAGICDGEVDADNKDDFATIGFDKAGVWFWNAHFYCTATAGIQPATSNGEFNTDLGFLRFKTQLKSFPLPQGANDNCFSVPVKPAKTNGLSLKTVVTLADDKMDDSAPVGKRKERTQLGELLSNISKPKKLDDGKLVGVGHGLIAGAGSMSNVLRADK